jgi:methyl-accepting chemotaxis protein
MIEEFSMAVHTTRIHSIQTKIGITLIVFTTLILSGFGMYQYRELKSSKEAALHNFADITIDRLAENLIEPLWDLNTSQVEKSILSEMREKSIYAIVVTNSAKERFVGKIRNENQHIVDTDEDISEGYITKNKDMTTQYDEYAGSVELYLTQHFIRAELSREMRKIVVTAVTLDFALFIVLAISLRILLIRPINRLLKISIAIADGDVSQNIDIRQDDEIGALAAVNRSILYEKGHLWRLNR